MALNTQQGLPGIPGAAMVGTDGIPTQAWYSFFLNLWQRTGGATGGIEALLDQITNVVGSMLYRATGGWVGLAPGAQYRVLRMGSSVPEWDVLDGNSFGSQSANEVFASPNGSSGIPTFRALTANDFSFGTQVANEFFASPNGSSGAPSFRTIATADLDGTAGQYPGTATNDNASAGNIGEYVSSTVASVSSVNLSNGTPTNITSISLTGGDWDVWGTIVFTNNGTTSTLEAGISSTSASLPAIETGAATLFSYNASGAPLSSMSIPIPPVRFSLSSTTTIYLVAESSFSTGASHGFGTIQARRVR